jgi:hypothetical protein
MTTSKLQKIITRDIQTYHNIDLLSFNTQKKSLKIVFKAPFMTDHLNDYQFSIGFRQR